LVHVYILHRLVHRCLFVRAQAQSFLSFSVLCDYYAVVKMKIYCVVHQEIKCVFEVLGLAISFSFFFAGTFLGASDFDDQFLINNYATFFWHYLFIFLIVFMVINMVVAIVVESFEENFKFRSENPYLEDSIVKTAVIFCITGLVPITSRLNIRCDDFCCGCRRVECRCVKSPRSIFLFCFGRFEWHFRVL
jgi:hypothetical protein